MCGRVRVRVHVGVGVGVYGTTRVNSQHPKSEESRLLKVKSRVYGTTRDTEADTHTHTHTHAHTHTHTQVQLARRRADEEDDQEVLRQKARKQKYKML